MINCRILQSFLLKSKLCACLCIKYFTRDLNRDLTLFHLSYVLEEKALGNYISKSNGVPS